MSSAKMDTTASEAPMKKKKKGGFARESFLAYYKEQQVVPPEEWEEFVAILDRALPACFRINYNCAYPDRLRERLRKEFQFEDGKFQFQGQKIGPPKELPWYPDSCGWKISCGRAALRKLGRAEPVLHSLHQFLISEVDTGNISRQEAVSMVPPLMLGVQPHHLVLDMCAAPGSKTAQIVEQMTHSAAQNGTQVQV
jgi:16S rRNA C967 or C1407 C5-methylase (RsmB/RsmF family)